MVPIWYIWGNLLSAVDNSYNRCLAWAGWQGFFLSLSSFRSSGNVDFNSRSFSGTVLMLDSHLTRIRRGFFHLNLFKFPLLINISFRCGEKYISLLITIRAEHSNILNPELQALGALEITVYIAAHLLSKLSTLKTDAKQLPHMKGILPRFLCKRSIGVCVFCVSFFFPFSLTFSGWLMHLFPMWSLWTFISSIGSYF